MVVLDLKTYQEVAKMDGHQSNVLGMVVVENVLYTIDKDTLKVWDLSNYGLVNSVPVPQEYGFFTRLALWNGKLATLTEKKPDVLLWECP